MARLIDFAAYTWLLWLVYRTATFYFFPYKNALTRYQRDPRAYALITGASGGIGYGYAQELIAHGFGVILMANRKEKLAAAASRLKSENPDAVIETVSFDARRSSNEELTSLLKPFLNLPITIVVNNVAAITVDPVYQTLSSHSADDADEMINVNTRFMVQISRTLIPTLVHNGPSAILHMGSAASVGAPYMSIYSGSKAFVTAFATAIAREAKTEGWKLDSIAIVPGEVWSEFNNAALPPGSPTSREYAKIALDRVEMAADRRTWVIVPYWLHAIQLTLLEKLPERVVQYLFEGNVRTKQAAFAKLQ